MSGTTKSPMTSGSTTKRTKLMIWVDNYKQTLAGKKVAFQRIARRSDL